MCLPPAEQPFTAATNRYVRRFQIGTLFGRRMQFPFLSTLQQGLIKWRDGILSPSHSGSGEMAPAPLSEVNLRNGGTLRGLGKRVATRANRAVRRATLTRRTCAPKRGQIGASDF